MARSFSPGKRATVLAKTAGHCAYCGKYLPDHHHWTFDHKLPRERGGSNAVENLVAACRTCNSAKGPRTVEEFRAQSLVTLRNQVGQLTAALGNYEIGLTLEQKLAAARALNGITNTLLAGELRFAYEGALDG